MFSAPGRPSPKPEGAPQDQTASATATIAAEELRQLAEAVEPTTEGLAGLLDGLDGDSGIEDHRDAQCDGEPDEGAEPSLGASNSGQE